MIVEVEMLAFGNGEIRQVDIPDEKVSDNVDDMLELAFHYGQNDFQPKNYPSVSVGDVVHYNGERYEVDMIGFKKV
jgi:hypothetical protein